MVDNASNDGAPDAIAERFPHARVIRLEENRGSCAKACGVDQADGEFVLFLDDDSCPRPGAIGNMFAHFAADPSLAAAGFRVHLPNGAEESSALAGVFVGCGVGLRRSALIECGGLDRDLFMQAEEYDLCFRLAAYGWRTDVFDDLHVDHDKSPRSRCTTRRAYLDTNNNLLVAARYIPDKYLPQVFDDWTTRYTWLYDAPDESESVQRAISEGRDQRRTQRQRYASHRLRPEAFERYFNHKLIHRRMLDLSQQQVYRILLARFGKNIHPFVAGAGAAGIQIAAIADDAFAAPNRTYGGIPVIPIAAAQHLAFDAVIIADTSPAHANSAADSWLPHTDTPIYNLTAANAADGHQFRSTLAETATV